MKTMRKFIEGIKSDNRGLSETIAIVYSLLIFMVFAVLYVDLYGYFYTKNNLKQAVDETIILMKADNGYDDTVTRQYFDNIVLKLGLDTTKITLSGTPKIVQRGELMELKASTAYEVKGLRPFNHNITLNIIVHSEGLAHAKVR